MTLESLFDRVADRGKRLDVYAGEGNEAVVAGFEAENAALERRPHPGGDEGFVVAASREVEEYAWRVGAGKLHASFQSLDAFDEQRAIYERLAADTELDVRVYTEPVPDGVPEITFHDHLTESADRFWIVVFDGCGDDARKCALVARQCDPDEYVGFWTYDSGTVDGVLATIEDAEPE